MNDELDRVKRAFRQQEPVEPRDEARKAAIHAAMEQFEEEKKSIVQGSGNGARLRERGNKLLTAFNRRRPMKLVFPKYSHMLAGGVSLAAIALVVNFNLTRQMPTDLFTGKNDGIVAFEPADEKRVERDLSSRQNELETAGEAKVTVEGLVQKQDARQQGGQNRNLQSQAENIQPPLGETLPSAKAKKELTLSRSDKSNGVPAVISKLRSLDFAAPSPSARLRMIPLKNEAPAQHYQDQGRDKFTDIASNPVKLTAEDPVSTFSVDVDTASYSFVRAALNRGILPQKDAVRVEELINYFTYDYAAPTDRAEPFKANVSIMPTPWNDNTKLMRIGIKGYTLPVAETPRANLVFLIDTSGSMNAPDKLPLLRNSFKLLLGSLKPDDIISIVTYAGSAGTALEPTKVSDRNKIMAALENLSSGGSTAGAEGIRQAYQLAESQMNGEGVNRVILATDGDFNVGITDIEELKSFVERKRKTGVTLSVLGFGRGNYNDELMQTLAQNGNGNAAYIDTLSEARKVLVEQAGGTLFTIAKDVKLQLEFNPARVSEYRLIGYETRQLKREDFNNDKVDAGDIGAGHTVTALYEITPVGASNKLVDDLRYQNKKAEAAPARSDEYAFMKIRYKQPDSDTSQLITTPVMPSVEVTSLSNAPGDSRFAGAVAAFGQLLRGGQYTGSFTYDDVISLAQSSRGDDRYNYRGEFISLVQLAKSAAVLEPQQK